MKRRRFISHMASFSTLALFTPAHVFSGFAGQSKNWHVQQFKDPGLAHFSYAILAGGKIILVDPQRDPQIYYDFAKSKLAEIVGVIETHPHADFVSAHLEIHRTTNASIYTGSLTKPAYLFSPFDEGKTIKLSDKITLKSLYTPGHAPDHIAVLLQEEGKDMAVFSGDALLIGDVGRPDLREYSKNTQAQRYKLADMMYHTIHDQFGKLADDVIVYPAHGAGSLCGKQIRDAASSTIGTEKSNNYAFQTKNKAEFIKILLGDLPFIPKYFPYDVQLNIKGAPSVGLSIEKVKRLNNNFQPEAGSLIVDGRSAAVFKKSYLNGAINIQISERFETWLGSVVAPDLTFYLVAENEQNLTQLIKKAAKIGYELNIKAVFIYNALTGTQFNVFDLSTFKPGNSQYTIIDVRTEKEAKENPIFKRAINIPLQDLSNRISELPTNKPILVHCASGYRSAAGSSIIKNLLPNQEVFDLGPSVTKYEASGATEKK
ncbi:rhodanese-like domain-containing protein [Pedobacter sp. MC2016-24]|uniref:MBL fold metallo-hydrolase n=1 Tax=Pedobacter sp. MC2016-24 TaxID=2780090 RepID=UPI00187FC3A9|nr:MBL fold metallo-hydrolase [Pedobacter sp. MC2016-24]MBE9600830.1 MBL fold metallo-hydrolase [Pedobacter sp. MC2016-24]